MPVVVVSSTVSSILYPIFCIVSVFWVTYFNASATISSLITAESPDNGPSMPPSSMIYNTCETMRRNGISVRVIFPFMLVQYFASTIYYHTTLITSQSFGRRIISSARSYLLDQELGSNLCRLCQA